MPRPKTCHKAPEPDITAMEAAYIQDTCAMGKAVTEWDGYVRRGEKIRDERARKWNQHRDKAPGTRKAMSERRVDL